MNNKPPSPTRPGRPTRLIAGLGAALLLVSVLSFTAQAGDLFTPAEQAAFDRALNLMNLTASDPGFAKDHGEPRLVLPWIRAALQDPALVRQKAAGLWSAVEDASGATLWESAGDVLELTNPAGDDPSVPHARDDWPGLDPHCAEALSSFMAEARRAHGMLEKAVVHLTEEERGYLAASALGGVFNAEDEEATRDALLELGVGQQALELVMAETRDLDAAPALDRLVAAAGHLERGALLEAGRIFQRAVQQLAEEARGLTNWPSATVSVTTSLGPVIVAAPGDALFDGPALLILTPDGCTTYAGAAGVANGLQGQFLSAIIDLAGDDTYRGETLLGPGSAVLGVSVVVDGGGDDHWHAAYAGQAAALYGVAWVDELGGDDVYRARGLAQGASVLGLAVLQDHAGNDLYEVGLQGQAFASLPGCAVLIDRAGCDRYLAGGREPDHERNPDRYLSLAQGFAIGLRPAVGGGVALLADLSGNDTYVADVYGQGVSYYYAAGFLMDGGGQDQYSVYHYGQGAGIHLSHGLLLDREGNDVYQGGILVQGAAHDFATGLLLDRAGRDTYVAGQNAQGHGMNNSFACLLDGAGDDVYAGRDTGSTQGVGNSGGERGYGSLGLLLDLDGRDTYSCGAQDEVPLLRPLYGMVYDQAAEGSR